MNILVICGVMIGLEIQLRELVKLFKNTSINAKKRYNNSMCIRF